MPQDANAASQEQLNTSKAKTNATDLWRQWYTTPKPIKRLFDRFPLVTYPSNELPKRNAGHRGEHALYVFTTEEGVQNGAASFNPGCLKWQTYLKMRDISFVTVPSNNHASPSGALPFLLPSTAGSSTSTSNPPVPSTRLQRWTRELTTSGKTDGQGKEGNDRDSDGSKKSTASRNASTDMRYEAYLALLDHRIRNAYLYSLYLLPSNFASIVQPLYINSSTSNLLVRFALARQLRAAAESELLKQSPIIDVEAIYRESDKALEALSELLGDNEHFFGEAKPGLFDASVFAYVNVLLDENLDWKDRRMQEGLRASQNLVAHRGRILKKYF